MVYGLNANFLFFQPKLNDVHSHYGRIEQETQKHFPPRFFLIFNYFLIDTFDCFLIYSSYEWSKDDFELGCALGKGKFGRVYVARERKTHYMVAMKIMFKSELTSGRVEKQVLREIEIQSRLK